MTLSGLWVFGFAVGFFCFQHLWFSSSWAAASAIKCYVCSGTGKQCSKSNLQDDKATYLHSCGLGFDRCLRVWTKLGDLEGVANTCANTHSCTSDILDAACDLAEKTVDKCKASCCDSDACNAATSVSFSVILAIMCSLIGIAFLK